MLLAKSQDTIVLSIEDLLMPLLQRLNFLSSFILGVSSLKRCVYMLWLSLFLSCGFGTSTSLSTCSELAMLYNPDHWELGWDLSLVLLGNKDFLFLRAKLAEFKPGLS